MPAGTLTPSELRALFSAPAELERNAFLAMRSLAALTSAASGEDQLHELVLRALEHRPLLGESAVMLDSLVREVGLFPFLEPSELGTADSIAYEYHRPWGMPGDLVFHRPQARIYRELMRGKSVILSAPTSFGKSLIIDAVISSKKYCNILVVVPTLALIDETRRRLGNLNTDYKVITHTSQQRAAANVFVLTQERALELDETVSIDFLVIDEFYKLSTSNDSARASLLNQVFYRHARRGVPFYMLGPSITGIASEVTARLECTFVVEPYNTVASDMHRVDATGGDLEALSSLCRELTGPTIVFCQSPKRAADVARHLATEEVRRGNAQLSSCREWLAANYHEQWHFAQALGAGIGVHHGRIPRALAQYVVRAFDEGLLSLLVCTSTLIEGVNTKAQNIVIFDNKINRRKYDYFTFNNIRGRSGRMFQHFVGHVYLFHDPPQDLLPFVDIPSYSQGADAPDDLLLQLDADDLTESSQARVKQYHDQQALSYDVLTANTGVEPQSQIAFAKALEEAPEKYHPLLHWTGYPTSTQVRGVCEIFWQFFGGSKLASSSTRSSAQLAYQIEQLRSAPTVRALIDGRLEYDDDPDESVQAVLDFLRLWATFHFPRLLRAIERIQRDVFSRMRLPVGSYDVFASRVESLFLDPSTLALDEYGIPLEIARRLEPLLNAEGSVDRAIDGLRRLDLSRIALTPFEADIVSYAIAGLPRVTEPRGQDA